MPLSASRQSEFRRLLWEPPFCVPRSLSRGQHREQSKRPILSSPSRWRLPGLWSWIRKVFALRAICACRYMSASSTSTSPALLGSVVRLGCFSFARFGWDVGHAAYGLTHLIVRLLTGDVYADPIDPVIPSFFLS